MQIDPVAIAAGLAAIFILAALAFRVPGMLQTDGLYSTAKLQFFIWTEVALFTYGYLFTAHAGGPAGVFNWCTAKDIPKVAVCPPKYNVTNKGPKFPDNLLLLMGLSITATAVSRAKGQPQGAVAAADQRLSLRAFVQDAGVDALSLPKAQMLAWTVVAAAVYVYTVLQAHPAFADATATSYPNIDAALLALVGLGQGAFVVNRFADKNSTD
ncbi:MAG TPA: hypothetical protein VGU66_16065 [Candidatus Elarobacter sp.]|nr:hypothetical protein [Candidatus Elarobacter sp.]